MLASTLFRNAFVLSVLFASMSRVASGDVIYVNNQTGDDTNDGMSATATGDHIGPVRSIQVALKRANHADTISLAKTDKPYQESIELTGSRYSGGPNTPFVIEGNGATISGAKSVPPWAWRSRANGVVEMRPQRKGYYLLLKDGKPLPEQSKQARLAQKDLKAGEWTHRGGSIFYKPQDGESIKQGQFAFAAEGTGISLYNVRNVVIRNVHVRHFRVDGIHAHGLCKEIVADNVQCESNARAGMAISGTCQMKIRNCEFTGSRLHSVRISGYASGRIDTSKLDKPVALR